MQETYIPAPEVISRRNSPTVIRLRITGQYLSLYLLAFLLGIVLCSLLDPASLPPIGRYTDAHFGTPFVGCTRLPDYAAVIMDSASGDIRAMLLILTFGFTMFCPLALSALTAWRGFALGFTSAYLCTSITEELIVLPCGGARFILFLAANVLIAAALVFLSAQAVLFSHRYREICGHPRKIFRSPFVGQYLFGYLTMFGFVMLVHTVYALCNLWIK